MKGKYRFLGREVDGAGNEVLVWESTTPIPGDSRHVVLSIRPELFWPERPTVTEEVIDWLGRMPHRETVQGDVRPCWHCRRPTPHVDICFETHIHPGFCTQMKDNEYWSSLERADHAAD